MSVAAEQFLLVQAEGGSADGQKLCARSLTDGVLTLGRSHARDVILPLEESAIGLHHCDLDIRDGTVWLLPRAHQETYIDDPAAPGGARQVEQPEQILPAAGMTYRTIMPGGLAQASAQAASSLAHTRLRVMLAASKEALTVTPQADRARRRQKSARQEISYIKMALASTLGTLLVALGLGAFLVQPAFAEIIAKLVDNRDKLDVIDDRLVDFRKRFDGTVTALEAQHGQTLGLLQSLPEKLNKKPSYYEAVQPAIWLVGYLGPDNNTFTGVGTAWVVAQPLDGRRSLITNAHVVRQLMTRVADGAQPVVRRLERIDEQDKTIELKLSTEELGGPDHVHPHAREFEDIRDRNRPQLMPVNVADIARLVLSDESEDYLLGPGLKIATHADLLAVKEADEIGYVGFPFENLSAGKPNFSQPWPMYVAGNVTRVSGPLETMGDPRDRQLLMLDAVATGGASGSPLFNSAGKVIGVVSGGDVMHLSRTAVSQNSAALAKGDEPDLRVPVGFTYAVRADAVSEFVNAMIDAERPGRWRYSLESTGEKAAAENGALRTWKDQNCRAVEPALTVINGAIGEGGRWVHDLAGQTPPNTSFYLRAQALSGGQVRAIDIVQNGEAPPASDQPPVFRLSKSRVFVNAAGDVQAIISGLPGTAVYLEQYVCPPYDTRAGGGR